MIATDEASPLTRLQIILVIVALACGGFAIGTGEFAIMGLLPDVASSFAVSTPILCHQCEDAPCENSCPNGAIVTGSHGVQVMASHCIGCKTCMLVCPFGAMNMVEQTSHGSMVRAQAHKCDLCHSREAGPACIEVCPTKALKLVTPMALETLQRDRQLRAARGAAPGIVR